MSIIKFIEQIENDLNNLKENGHREIDIDKLLAYMNDNKDRALEISEDQKQYEYQKQLEKDKFRHQLKMFDLTNLSQNGFEMFKSVLETAQTALRSVIIMNGGAAVALLAFIGNVWNSQMSKDVVGFLIWSIASFAVGTFFCAAGAGFRYLSQDKYAQFFSDELQNQINKIVLDGREENKSQSRAIIAGDGYRKAAIRSTILSYIAFLSGIACSVIAFYKQLT